MFVGSECRHADRNSASLQCRALRVSCSSHRNTDNAPAALMLRLSKYVFFHVTSRPEFNSTSERFMVGRTTANVQSGAFMDVVQCWAIFIMVLSSMWANIKLSLFYCSNSCTSLHFKILKSPTKTLKIRPYMFRSPLKPSSGGPWPYFVRLLNWNVDLHLL
jgi:hypothetical protein